MFIPLSAKQAVNHGFYFVKGKIVYIRCSNMVGKVTLTKMELIIYGIDKAKQKNMFVYCYMLKKNRVGR